MSAKEIVIKELKKLRDKIKKSECMGRNYWSLQIDLIIKIVKLMECETRI